MNASGDPQKVNVNSDMPKSRCRADADIPDKLLRYQGSRILWRRGTEVLRY